MKKKASSFFTEEIWRQVRENNREWQVERGQWEVVRGEWGNAKLQVAVY